MSAAERRTRLTLRGRLTFTYAALFGASGAAMAVLLYLFMSYGPSYAPTLTRVGIPTPSSSTPAGEEPGRAPTEGAAPSRDGGAAPDGGDSPGSPEQGVAPAASGVSPEAGRPTPPSDGGEVLAKRPTPSGELIPSGELTPSAGPTTEPDTSDSGSGQGLLSLEVSDKADFLQALLVFSAVVFLLLLVASVIVGWFVAGRMLAPLQKITATARGIADSTLHERIALAGPKDEIRELADTFNAMLRRLERAFEAQRRFAANASHELRTPLASMRTILQVALASPDPEELRAAGSELLVLNKRSTDTTQALLALARADHGAITQEPVDLGRLARELCVQRQPQARAAGVELTGAADADGAGPTGAADAAWVRGDPVLLRQLVGNLVDNALRHNHRGGTARVAVCRRDDGGVSLSVRNSGPRLDQESVDRAFEPFHRLEVRREGAVDGRPSGYGLGLAIVQSIVRAHDGSLTAAPLAPDGLEVSVDLPGTCPSADRAAEPPGRAAGAPAGPGCAHR
ncbi:putative sensor histidine kinase TcrY [Streptomyces sp. ADI96-02]|uniref:ATP-binding protein n=1 Tax=Streptomyces sp. ADI96-02 TaxID=1522760 RepID=UPI000F551199|nr:ATP-binding protein [Streptomyces sp. ADI96-02]RPK68221.1 putative sensor histidine kinase TcrY [Streptomyces sp. ADI96-02]